MRRFMLALILCAVLFLFSCATSGGDNVEVHFFSQGNEVATMQVSGRNPFDLPAPPVREGYTFNGWWIITDEDVAEFSSEYLAEHADELTGEVSVNARWINSSCEINYAFSTSYVQDGVVYGDKLFRFNSSGKAAVYDMETRRKVGTVVLDKVNLIKPHANCVFFGQEKVEETDELPVLYSNVYTSYSAAMDRREGTLCAYRLRNEASSAGTYSYEGDLVQVIQIGFRKDKDLWRSNAVGDRSPYGNFLLDSDNNKLWAFVTRDYNRTTRFFCFEMPSLDAGVLDETYGVKVVTLEASDIVAMFDVPYSLYLQGACYHDGKIYSTEGMGNTANPCSIRVIDLENGVEDYVIDLTGRGLGNEAELIDYWNGYLWYSDVKSNVYSISGF